VKKRLVIGLALATVLGPSGPAVAQSPGRDSVAGAISYGEGRAGLGFTFSTSSGPAGESPTGTVTIYTFVSGDLGTFPVSCLGVGGNRATIVASFPGTTPPTPAGVVIYVEDNGSSGDRIHSNFVSSVPSSCPPPATVIEDPFTFGDVTVVDAQALPTLRDQCKDGGWKTFGLFKNQGDCVSFVATKGKHPPAGH
jgi:hypothetical protein